MYIFIANKNNFLNTLISSISKIKKVYMFQFFQHQIPNYGTRITIFIMAIWNRCLLLIGLLNILIRDYLMKHYLICVSRVLYNLDEMRIQIVSFRQNVQMYLLGIVLPMDILLLTGIFAYYFKNTINRINIYDNMPYYSNLQHSHNQ